MKKISFLGWENCVELTSGDLRIVVTTEIGPRIIGAFFGDCRRNLFFADPALAGKNGGEKWVNYGGHRLWHSPEAPVRTYMPDNSPVQAVPLKEENAVSFITQGPDSAGITKTLSIFPQDGGTFRIEHTLENNGSWPIELAPWAITVMAPGGTAVLPQNPEREGLLPAKFIAVWPYTDMNDPRIVWGSRFILVKQDSSKDAKPMKIGSACRQGWIAYVNNNIAFAKSFVHDATEQYPDNNCSAEIYTCSAMLEAETLGPLALLNPGEKTVHNEIWSACRVNGPVESEDDAAAIPLFTKIGKQAGGGKDLRNTGR